MAKHKNSTRLFEVMQASRAKGKAFSLSTPDWWFKSRPDSGSTVVSSAPAMKPAVVATDDEPALAPPAPRKPGVDLKLDRERQQIHFRLTYTNMILTAFSVVVIVSLAYVFGKAGHTSPAPAYAGATVEQIKTKPANAKVLDLATKPRLPEAGAGVAPDKAGSNKPAAAAGKTPTQPVSVTQQAYVDAVRVNGRNYVVVQSYREKQEADEAKALLDQGGVPSTVENGLTGSYNKGWWCVVTQTGFDKIRSNAEYDALLKRIRSISDTYGGKSKFKKFDPLTYKWR